ncbi:anthrone oxygenase family protein [Nonomuraea spiralis]|uniref:Anthrone oxygenase family protein n=1 Tax=Nonomuraea spiralis TaxID=46182 RepID=A0ABV5IVS2_9ACTN|nr:anthrone oxygenase family protein [Nonomuraea spiralis]
MRTAVRYTQGAALVATGLLAGAFGYGAANVIPTFDAVPLDVRLTFHTTMMKVNEPVMQSAMALAILTTFGLAVAGRGRPRLLALGAGGAALASLLITVFGNVPLHAQFRKWAAGPVPSGYAETFQRWELFHTLRTLTALAAFVLIVTAALVARPSTR